MTSDNNELRKKPYERPRDTRGIAKHKALNIIGIFLCLAMFCTGFVIKGNISLYFNISGLLIVLGGTFGAALVSFRIDQLTLATHVLIYSYKKPVKSSAEIIEVLVDLSVKSKIQGLLSLQDDEEETTVIFLQRALGYLVDGHPGPQIRELLSSEMYFFKLRRERIERMFTTLAEISPAFGLVGSVVGLIAMLSGVGNSATILSTIPVALTSTLYGIIMSNFFFIPFATNLRERTNHELFLQKIILEGTVAIGSELHPRLLEKKLKAFITPSSRHGSLVSFQRIQEKFQNQRNSYGFSDENNSSVNGPSQKEKAAEPSGGKLRR